VFAQELTQESPFLFYQSTRTLQEMGDFPSFVIKADYRQISFLPPRGAGVVCDRKLRNVKINLPNYQGYFLLQWTTNDPAILAGDRRDDLAQYLQYRYTNGTVSLPGGTITGAGWAPSFTIEQTTAYHTKLNTKFLFLPLPDGVLEVSMTAPSANFSSSMHTFMTFLTYLQNEPIPTKAVAAKQ
jgi:hypothetical protein